MNTPYAEARDQIAPGDIIAIRNDGIIGKMFAYFDGLPYTHIGIANPIMGRVFVIQEDFGGAGIEFLSAMVKTHGADVYSCPAEGAFVAETAVKEIDAPTSYDYLDVLRIAASKILGTLGHPNLAAAVLPRKDAGGQVCSTKALHILRQAGFAAPCPLFASPADVVRAAVSAGAVRKLQIAKG